MDLIEFVMMGLLDAVYGNLMILALVVFVCVVVGLKVNNVPLPGSILVGGGIVFALSLYFSPIFGVLWALMIVLSMALFALAWLKLGRKVV